LVADPRLMPGFLQELFIARTAGQLTFVNGSRIGNRTPICLS
jgi:hypothetical protein